jgi:hypothetical protein
MGIRRLPSMAKSTISRRALAGLWAALAWTSAAAPLPAADVLVADRLSNAVFRFSETGALLGTVVADSANLNHPTGLALSPDLKHLYVSSFQNSRVIRYDYNYAAGTATAGVVFADVSDGLISPSDIQFSPDGGTIYVSSLGGSGVARFRPDGSSAGPPIAFAAPTSNSQFQFSGLALTPAGELLVGAFQDFPAGTSGAVGRYVSPNPTMDVFIPSATSLNGASGLLVHDGFVYVASMFASNIQRFNLATGAVDNGFAITDLGNPQELMLAPDGNGFFAGILGLADGGGRIAHYDFNGALIGDGIFAEPSAEGFTEATTFLTVPDPPPGDFNFDFLVNAADLTIWRQNFPNDSGTATNGMGDADGNGRVDGGDLLVWQRGVSGLPQTPAALVPEPAGLSVMLALLSPFARRRLGGQSRV